MHCVDTSFCIDLSNGMPEALALAARLDESRERLAIPAPALTEFLTGACAQGGRRLDQALKLASRLEVLPVSGDVAMEAARLGGQAIRGGTPIGTIDLLIAALSRMHRLPLVTRDGDFVAVPGLVIQTY